MIWFPKGDNIMTNGEMLAADLQIAVTATEVKP